MRWLARPFLWLLTCVVPVFIAACYGGVGVWDGQLPDGGNDSSGTLRRARGHVLNYQTGSGIKGIHVICLGAPADAGNALDDTYSLPGDGAFEIWYYEFYPCDTLRFEDVDGAENGGPFSTREIEFPPGEESRDRIVVALTPES
jgi:hypothetical protein